MKSTTLALAILGAALGQAARAEGERAGDFDYYVLALSWTPSWCEETGAARGDPQCETGRRLGWVVHGLWPQYEQGWPSYCRTTERDPTRAETAAMADVMGGAGLAFYEWKKHGRCTGLSAQGYYATLRQARATLTLPELFTRIDRDLTLPARIVEEAVLEANPGLAASALTVTCDQGAVAELRLCLTTDLAPRPCAPDVARDCALDRARLPALR